MGIQGKAGTGLKPSEILAVLLVVAEAVFPLQFRMGYFPCQTDLLQGGATLVHTREPGPSLLQVAYNLKVFQSLL